MKLSDHYTVIGVTGHTSGIGKAIHDRFIGSIGFSKSNGYGIKFESEAILDALEDYHVFINNAYDGFSQVNLLYEFVQRYPDKKIINISSNSSDGNKNKIHPYAIHKAALDKASEQLFYLGYNVTNLKLGWVDTPRTEHKDVDKMDPEYVAEVVYWIVQQPHRIKELTITP
jgi:NADP-dependent 3-hydroxy acid dehydrogenase YdfG